MYAVIPGTSEIPTMVFESGLIYVACEDRVRGLGFDEGGIRVCDMFAYSEDATLFEEDKFTDSHDLAHTESFVLISNLLNLLVRRGDTGEMDALSVEEVCDEWISRAYSYIFEKCHARTLVSEPSPLRAIEWVRYYFNPNRTVYLSIRSKLEAVCRLLGLELRLEKVSNTTHLQVYPAQAIDLVEWYVRENPSYLAKFRKEVSRRGGDSGAETISQLYFD